MSCRIGARIPLIAPIPGPVSTTAVASFHLMQIELIFGGSSTSVPPNCPMPCGAGEQNNCTIVRNPLRESQS